MELSNIAKRIVWFDLETTGFNIFHNKIIEIAAIDNFGNKFETLINPECVIPKKITEITKITQDMVIDKPCIQNTLLDFVDYLNGTKLYDLNRNCRKTSYCIGHNSLAFDVPFIKAQSTKNNIVLPEFKVLDTMRISQYLLPNNFSHSLASLSTYYELTNNNAHRAMSDVLTTRDIFINLFTLFREINMLNNPYRNNSTNLILDIDLIHKLTTIK